MKYCIYKKSWPKLYSYYLYKWVKTSLTDSKWAIKQNKEMSRMNLYELTEAAKKVIF